MLKIGVLFLYNIWYNKVWRYEMKTETLMRKIQEADIFISEIVPEETYDFAIDLNNAIEKIGKYSVKYYDRMEKDGYTYKEAQDELGKYLRSNLTIIRNDIVEDTLAQ
jgi:hypothetical protein